MKIKKLITNIFQYILVPSCCFCDRRVTTLPICAQCLTDLPWNNYACKQCGQVLPVESQNVICGQCLRITPAYERTLALFQYDDLIAKTIQLLKFKQQLVFAKLFGTLFIERIRTVYQSDIFPTLIIPVPLHKQRLFERGFNQALEIARPIAAHFNLPLTT